MEKREHLYTVDGNINWYHHYRKQYDESSKKLKVELLPYTPAISVLDIHPKKMKSVSQRDICIAMFIVELFTIAKIRKHSKYLSRHKWIKKLICIYYEKYSAMRKKEILPCVIMWMNLEYSMLSEVS